MAVLSELYKLFKMYEPTTWKDEVRQNEGRYREEPNDDGSVTHVPDFGVIYQEGTPQDAKRFNNMEEGILAANKGVKALMDAQLSVEHGVVSLNNTMTFPFNNSALSVPLELEQSDVRYVVNTEIISVAGNIGEVVVSDKLENGFKIAYTGSAPEAVVKYTVIGGYTQ